MLRQSSLRLTSRNLLSFIKSAAIREHTHLIEISLSSENISQPILNSILQSAAGGGHLHLIERLFQEKADVNADAGYRGRTALQAAAEGGHLHVAERLHAADVK